MRFPNRWITSGHPSHCFHFHANQIWIYKKEIIHLPKAMKNKSKKVKQGLSDWESFFVVLRKLSSEMSLNLVPTMFMNMPFSVYFFLLPFHVKTSIPIFHIVTSFSSTFPPITVFLNWLRFAIYSLQFFHISLSSLQIALNGLCRFWHFQLFAFHHYCVRCSVFLCQIFSSRSRLLYYVMLLSLAFFMWFLWLLFSYYDPMIKS